ncbi:hypothetical protein GDO81_024923 [Engystomops pustulosus]|uniref:Uncharacterized protein n=1 Tax=Engystomops pustulosus TaxID=76066 RepID=A0AAV6YM80_ENGPU|nr:hypothetical protein GDO81_024923 [Engystomops pustulosus]
MLVDCLIAAVKVASGIETTGASRARLLTGWQLCATPFWEWSSLPMMSAGTNNPFQNDGICWHLSQLLILKMRLAKSPTASKSLHQLPLHH